MRLAVTTVFEVHVEQAIYNLQAFLSLSGLDILPVRVLSLQVLQLLVELRVLSRQLLQLILMRFVTSRRLFTSLPNRLILLLLRSTFLHTLPMYLLEQLPPIHLEVLMSKDWNLFLLAQLMKIIHVELSHK